MRAPYLANIAFILPQEVENTAVGYSKAPISVPTGKPAFRQGLLGVRRRSPRGSLTKSGSALISPVPGVGVQAFNPLHPQSMR